MFTGIVKAKGVVEKIERKNNGRIFYIKSSLSKKYLAKGESIAVNGVCLTVETYSKGIFNITAVDETLRRTNFRAIKNGSIVNLEPAMRLNDLVSGHLVSGHIDFTAKVVQARSELLLEIPKKYMKYLPVKGSICVEGVSLTIADVKKNQLKIALIPETLNSTNLSNLERGDNVNVEIDLICKYLEGLLNG